MQDEQRLIAILVQKLGGEVSISNAEILAADSLELQRSEDQMDFNVAIRFRIRDASVVDGELVDEGERLGARAEIEVG